MSNEVFSQQELEDKAKTLMLQAEDWENKAAGHYFRKDGSRYVLTVAPKKEYLEKAAALKQEATSIYADITREVAIYNEQEK